MANKAKQLCCLFLVLSSVLTLCLFLREISVQRALESRERGPKTKTVERVEQSKCQSSFWVSEGKFCEKINYKLVRKVFIFSDFFTRNILKTTGFSFSSKIFTFQSWVTLVIQQQTPSLAMYLRSMVTSSNYRPTSSLDVITKCDVGICGCGHHIIMSIQTFKTLLQGLFFCSEKKEKVIVWIYVDLGLEHFFYPIIRPPPHYKLCFSNNKWSPYAR